MGSLTKRQKEQIKYRVPQYYPSDDEQKWYMYCIENDIRISPIGISQTPGKWYIGISAQSDYRKVYKSKHIYDKDTLWIEFFNMCKFYYDKR